MFDINKETALYKIPTCDTVESLDWSESGSLISSISKNNSLEIFDARSDESPMKVVAHSGAKPARVKWLDENHVLTVGFNRVQRGRELLVWDLRNGLSTPTSTTKIDNSQGVITPLYDNDTGMLYLCGSIRFLIT